MRPPNVGELMALHQQSVTLEALKADLRRLLMDIASLPDGFDETADLYRELGMASVKAMELLMTLEERYAISVPDESFIEATSLNQLVILIRKLKSTDAT